MTTMIRPGLKWTMYLAGAMLLLVAVFLLLRAIVVRDLEIRSRQFDDFYLRVQNSSSIEQMNQLLGVPWWTLSESKDRGRLSRLCYRPKTNAPADAMVNVYPCSNGFHRFIFVIYQVNGGATNIVNVDWGNM